MADNKNELSNAYQPMVDDIKEIIEEGRNKAYSSVNSIMTMTYLKDNEHLFATKYKLNLPSEEQLKVEIERQKEIFYMQHPALKEKEGEADE